MPSNISWMTIGATFTMVAAITSGSYAINQAQLSSLKDTEIADRTQALLYYNTNRDDLIRTATELKSQLTELQSVQATILSRLAHDPVEDRTFQAVIAAVGKQIDQTQAQIADINRQIAAALIIIDNNSGPKRNLQPPP